jgi:hypothetical protein
MSDDAQAFSMLQRLFLPREAEPQVNLKGGRVELKVDLRQYSSF